MVVGEGEEGEGGRCWVWLLRFSGMEEAYPLALREALVTYFACIRLEDKGSRSHLEPMMVCVWYE